jgi:hypothetical protein
MASNQPISTEWAALADVHEAFNARDIDRALSAMHPDVAWAERYGRRICPRPRRCSGLLDPAVAFDRSSVEPLCFAAEERGAVVVDVHQIEHGLIRRMEIRG